MTINQHKNVLLSVFLIPTTMKIIKRIIQAMLGALVIAALFLGIFLFYISQKDYIPNPVEELQVIHKANKIVTGNTFNMIIWNLGYAGLGSQMDFFYDGGSRTRASEAETRQNMEGIKKYIQSQHDVDFWLFQEVDFHAKRTYGIDESIELAHCLPDYSYVAAVNYDVPFVPVPLSDPMGKVKAGLMSFSRFSPRMARRYAYPQIAGWPERLFLLDRCFSELRINIEFGKDLVILNTHNSAFIEKQNLMDMELAVIRNKILREYESGNYVIVAGDWNMNPPGLTASGFRAGYVFRSTKVFVPSDFISDEWNYAFDGSTPSNRWVDQPYVPGKTPVTTIDFFLTSPNVGILSVEAADLGFLFSDHNPVKLQFVLQ